MWVILSDDMAEAASPSASGRYRFVRNLAEGGMGRVELAVREEGRFRRVYAIKRLRDQFLDDAELRAMFLEEARIAGLLRHPNLVGVIDAGEDERGPFLVMDFVEGVPLSMLMAEAAVMAEPIPVALCVTLARQIAEGLHAAHELKDLDGNSLQLVHRDVSPQNVILGFDGVARLTDFGIAKALGRAHRTTTGILKGKSGYFSPEQLQFEEPDRRSDVFSLGIVLYELLAAKRLYGGDDPVLAAKRILREPPPDVAEVRPDVHPMLVKLLFEMLAKDREQRPADARAVERLLEQIQNELALEDDEPVRASEWVNERFSSTRDQQRGEIRELTMPEITPSGSGAKRRAPTADELATTRAAHMEIAPETRPMPVRRGGVVDGPSAAVLVPSESAETTAPTRVRRAGRWIAGACAAAVAIGVLVASLELGPSGSTDAGDATGGAEEGAIADTPAVASPPPTAMVSVPEAESVVAPRPVELAPAERASPRTGVALGMVVRSTAMRIREPSGSTEEAETESAVAGQPAPETPTAMTGAATTEPVPPTPTATERRNQELMTWPEGRVSPPSSR